MISAFGTRADGPRRHARPVFVLGAILLLAACGPPGGESASGADERDSTMKRPTIEQAQARLTEKVMQEPGVVGTMIGECDGEPCIVVMIAVVERRASRGDSGGV